MIDVLIRGNEEFVAACVEKRSGNPVVQYTFLKITCREMFSPIIYDDLHQLGNQDYSGSSLVYLCVYLRLNPHGNSRRVGHGCGLHTKKSIGV